MAAPPGFLRPPAWTNQDLILYHGTVDAHVRSIRKRIELDRGNPETDFGRGFYTTTSRRQARSWAWQLSNEWDARSSTSRPSRPVVIRFRVSRDDLARLDGLCFVRGDFHAEGYWSLVHHCRTGHSGHGRPTADDGRGWYDVVSGPIAAVWKTRLVIANVDQYSFHTGRGAGLLDRSPKRVEGVR